MAGKGKRFELQIKNNITENTPAAVKAHRPDFSGSSNGEVADVMVVWEDDRKNRFVDYIELKKRSGVDEGNRKTVMSGSSDGQSGMGELHELIDESPPWTRQWVGVKFANRELIMLNAVRLAGYLEEGGGEDRTFHAAKRTRGHNISMRKPELEWWPSSTAGMNDHEKVCQALGIGQ